MYVPLLLSKPDLVSKTNFLHDRCCSQLHLMPLLMLVFAYAVWWSAAATATATDFVLLLGDVVLPLTHNFALHSLAMASA